MSEDELRSIEAFARSRNARTADLTMMGNRNTMIQIVDLLSQIRTAIKHNQKHEMTLKIGENVQDTDFDFLINDSRADDRVPRDVFEIN